MLPVGVGYVVNLEGDNFLGTVERTVGHTGLPAAITAFRSRDFIAFVNESALNYVDFFPKGVSL